MRYETRTERIGEDVGPIDWSHPMIAAELAKKISNPCRTDNGMSYRAPLLDLLREVEKSPGDYEATTDGGWPKVGWGEVLAVRMYDGWPYWRPTPSVLIKGWAGSSWHAFNAIAEVRKVTR